MRTSSLVGPRAKSVSRSDSVKVDRSFDGPLWTGDVWSGAIEGSVEAGYDDNFWLTQLTVNSASTVHYARDDDGLVTSARVRDDELLVVRGADTGMVAGSELGTVLSWSDYNDFGELIELSSQIGPAALFDQQIERDALGRVDQLVETVGGTTHLIDYAYDSLGRLVEVERDGIVTTYSYDENGNRLSRRVDGTTAEQASYDAQDRPSSYGNWLFEHSAHGDLQRRTTGSSALELSYDALGNLMSATVSEGEESTSIDYKVDGMGRRISRSVDGKFERAWVYQDSLRPVGEVSGAGVFSHFVYAADSRPGGAPDFMIRQGTPYRFVKDHLGSVRLVVNADTGAIVQRMDFDSFGRVLSDTNPGFQPFGFAGGLYDPDTGLIRFGARDYDPLLGRWTAKDPIGFAGRQMNVYVYVGNDPVNSVDPLGLWGMTFGFGAGAGLTYLGGGVNVSIGVFIGSDGFGFFGGANYSPGLGGYIGAGPEIGVYADRKLEGPSAGLNVEVPGGGVAVNVTPEADFSSLMISAGPHAGFWIGPTAGYTGVVNITDILYNALGGPPSCDDGWGRRQPEHNCGSQAG